MPKPCTWNGVDYPSEAALARALGVHRTTVSKWLKKGYTGDADVPDQGNAPNVYVELDGQLCSIPMKSSDRLFQDEYRVLYQKRLQSLAVLGRANQRLEDVTQVKRETLLDNAPAELVRYIETRWPAC